MSSLEFVHYGVLTEDHARTRMTVTRPAPHILSVCLSVCLCHIHL